MGIKQLLNGNKQRNCERKSISHNESTAHNNLEKEVKKAVFVQPTTDGFQANC